MLRTVNVTVFKSNKIENLSGMIFEVKMVFLQVSKAAIGLARLCLDPTTADSVVRLGGLDKLFPLAEVSN